DALAAVYPVVQRLLGQGFFEYACDAFIRRHPPRSGNLHDFGAEFAEFLAGFEAASTLTYLPDTARLEWSWHVAFHAADQIEDVHQLSLSPCAAQGRANVAGAGRAGATGRGQGERGDS